MLTDEWPICSETTVAGTPAAPRMLALECRRSLEPQSGRQTGSRDVAGEHLPHGRVGCRSAEGSREHQPVAVQHTSLASACSRICALRCARSAVMTTCGMVIVRFDLPSSTPRTDAGDPMQLVAHLFVSRHHQANDVLQVSSRVFLLDMLTRAAAMSD